MAAKWPKFPTFPGKGAGKAASRESSKAGKLAGRRLSRVNCRLAGGVFRHFRHF